jgi:hypothetical protein
LPRVRSASFEPFGSIHHREVGEIALDTLYGSAVPRADLRARFFYHISKDMLDEVNESKEPEKKGEKVFSFIESDMSFWSRDGVFLNAIPADRFNKGFSNPSFKKIRRCFNRFGYEDYRSDLFRRLKSAGQPTITMVNHLVDVRNKIAHGDPTALKTPSEVKDMINTMNLFLSINRFCICELV